MVAHDLNIKAQKHHYLNVKEQPNETLVCIGKVLSEHLVGAEMIVIESRSGEVEGKVWGEKSPSR